MKYEHMTIIVSAQVFALLTALTNTGLHGANPPDVAQRLLDEALLRELRDGTFLQLRVKDEDTGPKCSTCGSPKLRPAITMGGHDLECADCGAHITL